MNCIQWKQGLSADMGVSHSFHWPSKPGVSPEAPAQAAQKYLTGIKKKPTPKCSRDPKWKPDVERADAWNVLSIQDRIEKLADVIIY